MRFVWCLGDNFERENDVERFGVEGNVRDRCLRYFAEATLPDVLESGSGNVQSVNVPRISRGIITQIEAGPTSCIEDSQIRLTEIARGNGVCDFPHRREPPIVFFEFVQELKILFVHPAERYQ